MFELPEYVNLSKQINETFAGKIVKRGTLGNTPHKFVWYNRTHQEFEQLTKDKKVGEAKSKGRWLFIPLTPGYVLVLGECGGKALYHQPGSKVPEKYHLYLVFNDNSFFTVTTQMWGAMELYEKGKELEGKYVKDMKITPLDPEFTFTYFCNLIDTVLEKEKKSAKGLLTQDQIIPGLGNAIAQDILFKANLHPKHPIDDLEKAQKQKLYDAIVDTTKVIIEKGGRYDEYDLYNNKGRYIRIMDKNALNRPCPQCGGDVKKIQYLGGACYFCSKCQQ